MSVAGIRDRAFFPTHIVATYQCGRTNWRRFQVDACSRQLSSVAAQCANDFGVERMLQRDLGVVRTNLHDLTQGAREFDRDPVGLPPTRLRPYLVHKATDTNAKSETRSRQGERDWTSLALGELIKQYLVD